MSLGGGLAGSFAWLLVKRVFIQIELSLIRWGWELRMAVFVVIYSSSWAEVTLDSPALLVSVLFIEYYHWQKYQHSCLPFLKVQSFGFLWSFFPLNLQCFCGKPCFQPSAPPLEPNCLANSLMQVTFCLQIVGWWWRCNYDYDGIIDDKYEDFGDYFDKR